MEEPRFPFYYGEQGKMHSFVRIPKVLLDNPAFAGVSTDAKILYGLFLDRMQMSARNRWFDEKGRVYIYFTVEQIRTKLRCSNKTVTKLLAELDDKSGVGLVTRVRQGRGKPDRIYVHQCVTDRIPDVSEDWSNQDDFKVSVETGAMDSGDIRGSPENLHSESEVPSLDFSYKKPLQYEECEQFFRSSLSIEELKHDDPLRQDRIEELLLLIVDTVCSQKDFVMIGGEMRPMELVKNRLMKLNAEHIRYVLFSLEQHLPEIRNIRQYMLAALYNAPVTISHYYTAKVAREQNWR